MLTPGALRITELAMQSLQAAGFSASEAARAYRTVFLYTFGFASFAPDGPGEELERQTAAALLSLSRQEYPAITAAPRELAATMRGDEQFEWGLQRILDGIEEGRDGR